jgi:hypothetical protein
MGVRDLIPAWPKRVCEGVAILRVHECDEEQSTSPDVVPCWCVSEEKVGHRPKHGRRVGCPLCRVAENNLAWRKEVTHLALVEEMAVRLGAR